MRGQRKGEEDRRGERNERSVMMRLMGMDETSESVEWNGMQSRNRENSQNGREKGDSNWMRMR